MKEYIIKIDHDHTEGMQELVRCKDCKFWERRECGKYRTCNKLRGFRSFDWFCADGERKEDGEVE